MTLLPETTEAGLWRNPLWTPGTPGVFALVIGVSRYQYLKEDQNSLHMGSLHVSALTAFQFFEWLSDVYQLEGVPVASCRLLLSPTEAERAFEPKLSDHIHTADFDHCSNAIVNWFAEMAQLGDGVAAESRSLFFFSGHGLEVTEEMQVLLPEDYLRPPVSQYNRAIGTDNLRRGLKGLKVNRHFLFMDACRNDHDNLQQVAPIEGSPILNAVKGTARNPRCLVPLFFSSAAGRESFQPRRPQDGLSLFGSALLEGLRGSGFKPNCDQGRCVIHLDPLLGYCKQRIPRIAKEKFNQEVEQEVRLSGDYVQDPLTEVPPPPPPPTVLGLGPEPPSVEAEPRYSIEATVPPNWRPDSFLDGHNVFQSERVTEPFLNAKVFSYATGEWLQTGNDYVIHRVRHSDSRRFYEIEFSLKRPLIPDSIYWLQLDDAIRTFGVVIPSGRQNIRFLLNLELSYNHEFSEPSHFARVSLNLAETSERPFAMLARAWNAYREASLSSAKAVILSPESETDLEAALRDKVESPLGAAVAGLLLVKGEAWPRVHNWLRNVANQFPWFGDGCVLWAEQLLRQFPSSNTDRREAFKFLLELDRRELPLLAEVLAMAYSRLLEFADDSEFVADGTQRRTVERLIARYKTAIVDARSGGLFTVWAGAKDEITPAIVLRTYERPQANIQQVATVDESKPIEIEEADEKYFEAEE